MGNCLNDANIDSFMDDLSTFDIARASNLWNALEHDQQESEKHTESQRLM